MGYFVYLLRSKHHKGASYIGFSTDVRHRLRQHNGEVKGGARHTSKYSPWTHVCVVSGFMNKSMALMFEWHWQHPSRSLVLKEAARGVKHHGRGPLGKLLLLSALLGDRMWTQCELTVNFLEDEGWKAFEKIKEKYSFSASITWTRVESDDLDIMTKAQPCFIDAANRAKSTAENLGSEVVCAICRGEVETSKDKYLWCCSECGTAQHILCSASGAMEIIRKEENQRKNTYLPTSYTCHRCRGTVSRMAAARMTFSPQFLTADRSDANATRRLSGQITGDDDDDDNDEDNASDDGEDVDGERNGGKIGERGWDDRDGFSVTEDGEIYLGIDNTWSQHDALDGKDHHRLGTMPRNQFNEPEQATLTEGAEETRNSFIYSDSDTNATDGCGGGGDSTMPFYDLTQM